MELSKQGVIETSLTFKWVRAKFNGSIDNNDMMEITGLSEYEVGRIGLIGYAWGIEVRQEWTASL